MAFPIYFSTEKNRNMPDTSAFLPFVFDPAPYTNGALPVPWTATTFQVDGLEIKNVPLAAPDNFALLEGSEVNQIVRARVDYTYGEQAGVIAKANALTNPDSYLLAYYENYDVTYCRAVLEKYVNGVKTELINDWTNTPYDGGGDPPGTDQWLEIRVSGTTVQMFQNGVQVGTDQTVSNAEIIGNTKCGMYLNSTASRILRFYCGRTGLKYDGAFGSSLTVPTYGHAQDTHEWLNEYYPWSFVNQALSGHWPFSNLMRLNNELLAGTVPEIVFCDFKIFSDWDYYALEAIVRKIWALNYRTRIISPIFPSTPDPATNVISDQTQKELDSIALGKHYGVYFVDLRADIINRVASGEALSTYMSDTIHLTAAGHAQASALEQALILNSGLLYSDDHNVLPAYYFDSDGYWSGATQQRVDGADNNGETGTGWADCGTNGRESSTAGDIITFNSTCRMFGLYSSATPNTVCDVRIDGGTWQTNITVTHNGYYGGIIADAPHVLEFRVRAGVPIRVDEFWAI